VPTEETGELEELEIAGAIEAETAQVLERAIEEGTAVVAATAWGTELRQQVVGHEVEMLLVVAPPAVAAVPVRAVRVALPAWGVLAAVVAEAVAGGEGNEITG